MENANKQVEGVLNQFVGHSVIGMAVHAHLQMIIMGL
jgi:hypothetical protein